MNIRNVAIIAHVDHGKTTLVDALLKQSKTHLHKDSGESLIMDSNELEKERGITIFSKNASVIWNGAKINIIDTPGHADFGGEVERVLKMADGCLLLVDAKEGPMPQTRFVLKKALELGHKIIVVVNKIDRSDARIDWVLGKTLDLFLELGADDATAEFPIVYASGKSGKAGLTKGLDQMSDISPVFEAILEHIPPPSADPDAPLQMLITSIARDPHLGRIAIGRVENGVLSSNSEVVHINRDGVQKKYKLTSLMTFQGLDRVPASLVPTGDIAAVSGITDINIGETIADPQNPEPLPLLSIEQPTIKMTFMVNNSPFAGHEGQFKTSRELEARFKKEAQTDMALRVVPNQSGGWEISGRGELHLAIFIERLRREGYEFQVARPQVVNRVTSEGTFSPYEQVFIEVPEADSGIVMQKLGLRRGELKDMQVEKGICYMEFIISTSGLFGYRSEFITDTKGLGIINSSFYEYRPDLGFIPPREQGSLVAFETGQTNLYGLTNVQDRGQLFVGPGVTVYKGQVVGQNSRAQDIHINVCRTKQLSNMRSKGDGKSEHFNTPKVMNLEDALEYINDEELVEVTPQTIRIRKIVLDELEQKRKKSQGME